jgi:hypothetical protein
MQVDNGVHSDGFHARPNPDAGQRLVGIVLVEQELPIGRQRSTVLEVTYAEDGIAGGCSRLTQEGQRPDLTLHKECLISSLEQGKSEGALDFFYLGTQVRLSDAEPLSGPPKMQGVGHCQKVPKPHQLETPAPYALRRI